MPVKERRADAGNKNQITMKLKQILFKRQVRAEAAMADRIEELSARVEALERALAAGKDHRSTGEVLAALKNHLRQKGLSLQDIQNATGITVPALSDMLEGRRNITKDQARRMASAYSLNADYLLHGNGHLTARRTVPKEKGRPASGAPRGERNADRMERYYLNKFAV